MSRFCDAGPERIGGPGRGPVTGAERSATVRPALNFRVRLRRWVQIARIGGMAIRELSYVLRRDPGTGDDRLTPVTAVPDDVPGHLMERVIAATHRAEPAVGAALSYTRLPHRDGGGLLCSAHPDEKSAVLRVDAQYAAGDDATWPRLPVDAWRPAALRGPDDEPFAEPGRRWDEPLLVRHVREHAPRVAPFLADVRRLFADPAGRQIVVAEPDQETVARWIALACASLPEAHARSLTFTTATADPGGAPQQILGIGPDTDPQVFDRYDVLTVTHHYRVHDGLGGPGSPPLTDAWAELTAWLWREGTPRGRTTSPSPCCRSPAGPWPSAPGTNSPPSGATYCGRSRPPPRTRPSVTNRTPTTRNSSPGSASGSADTSRTRCSGSPSHWPGGA